NRSSQHGNAELCPASQYRSQSCGNARISWKQQQSSCNFSSPVGCEYGNGNSAQQGLQPRLVPLASESRVQPPPFQQFQPPIQWHQEQYQKQQREINLLGE